MTEVEWLTCTDTQPMLKILPRKASDRKLRLLMAAACRRALPRMEEPQYLALIEAGERVAEGTLSPASLARYRTDCPPISASDLVEGERAWRDRSHQFDGPALAKRAVWLSGGRDRHRVEECLHYAAGGRHARPSAAEELANQCQLIRDIFGPLPFRSVTIASSVLTWHDAASVRLAQAAYKERCLPEGSLDTGRLAVLRGCS